MIIAIQHDLQLYVTEKLDAEYKTLHRYFTRPLLYYALAMLTIKGAPPDLRQRDHVGMVQLLLRLGTQPHEQFRVPPLDQPLTVFGVFLGQIYK